MAYEFILGVDVVAPGGSPLTMVLTAVEKADNNASDPHYRVDRLDLVDGIEDVDAAAEYLQSLLSQKPYVARTVPVINQTAEYGQAVRTALQDRGLAPVGVTLSEGTTTVSGNRGEMNAAVSVRRAVDTLRQLYHDGRVDLQAQQDTEAASRLVRAIEWFSESGTDEQGEERRVTMALTPDEGNYEPVMVSTMLACWLGEEQTFDPTERLKTPLQGRRT